MLKRLAILAVLLAIAQAPMPMPGQATEAAAQGSGKPDGKGQSANSQSTPSVPLGKPQNSPSADKGSGQPTGDDKERSVKLTSLPPVTIAEKQKAFWDLVFDWGPWAFGLFLAIAGGVQLWLLKITWKTIKEQKTEMAIQTGILKDSVTAAKDSAKAATDQIEMMKEKERARIQVIPGDFNAVDPTEPNKIIIEFVNIGPTNAFDVRVEAGARVTVDGFKPEQGEYTDLAVPTLLKPEKPESSWVVWDFPRRWRDEVVDDRVRIIFEVTGQIKYRDVFDTTHTEDFSYRMNVYGIEDMPRNFIGLKLMRKWYPFDLRPGEWEF